MRALCIVALLLAIVVTIVGLHAVGAQSPSGESLALSLRSDVVRIVAQEGNGSSRDGFGFVVGEQAGLIYVVTANHVVRGNGPDEIVQHPWVIFFADQGKRYEAELLATHLPNAQGDLAILRVRPPPGFTWIHRASNQGTATRDTAVWFVGKQGQWYVPARAGAVNDIEPTGTIRVEGLLVTPGTSGAPLISQNGIIGMVVGQTDITVATPLDVIKRAVDDWHYPWNLETAKSANTAAIAAPVPAVHPSAFRLAVVASLGDGPFSRI